MFTGIVDHFGEIIQIDCHDVCRLSVKTLFTDLIVGESIAVDGICLTVTSFKDTVATFDISPETLSVTTARLFHKGNVVNLERAMRLSDRFGGHIVLGHVDTTLTLVSKFEMGEFIALTFSGFKEEDKAFLLKKGCIAINGVSLTINDVFENQFNVMIIPQTLAKTNIGTLNINDRVNIEYDYFAKIIRNHYLSIKQSFGAIA